MDMLRKPKVLFFARIAQLIFAIAFLILVSWCGTHRGYWIYNVTAAIAIGVIATLLTFVITGHGIWIYSRKNPFAGHGKVYTYSRLALEILMILIWIGTASLSLRNKGEVNIPTLMAFFILFTITYVMQDFSQVLNLPPFVQWDICIAFTFVEIISFILTTVLVFVEDHTSGMKIRNTTSASYV